MRRGFWFLALWALLASGCGGAPKKTAKAAPSVNRANVRVPLEVRTHKLGNGLEVIVSEDHRTPQVAVNLCYHVGSKDDPAGRGGLAHFYEHLMFDGTTHAERMPKYLAEGGVISWNGTTSVDRTDYFETVPTAMLERTLWLEADRMAFQGENSKSLVLEKSIVKNERRERIDDAPYGRTDEEIRRRLFPEGHPYRHTPIGTLDEIDAISKEDVALFRRRYYVPDNATLVIVGDVNVEATLKLVETYFGDIPARGGPRPAIETPIPVTLDDDILVTMEADVEYPRLYATYAAPAFSDAKHVALKDATGYVGGVLDDRVVREDKLAKDARAYYWDDRLTGTFGIELDLERGVTFAAARSSMDDALARLSPSFTRFTSSPVALSARTSRLILDLEDITTRARQFNFYQELTRNPLEAILQVRRYATMDPEDTQRAYRDWVLRAKAVILYVRPAKGAPRSGKVVANP